MARLAWFIFFLAIGALSGFSADESSDNTGAAKVPAAVVKTATLEAVSVAQKIEGVASVLAPDPLIQLNGDLHSATIAAAFSKREAERYKAAKVLSLHVVEGAQKQADTDAAQVSVLQSRLRQTWGEASPFLNADERDKLVADISAGKIILVRLDFPQAVIAQLQNVLVIPLAGGKEVPVSTLWLAPSGNPGMPGISYFGLLDAGPGLRQLDRARVIADSSNPQTGVVVPSSALIVFAGETWCYVEISPQKFERVRVPLTWPVDTGYLVQDGLMPGTRVVVRGASTLLSREAGPEDDDEADGGAKPVEDKPIPPKPDNAKPAADSGRNPDPDDQPSKSEPSPDENRIAPLKKPDVGVNDRTSGDKTDDDENRGAHVEPGEKPSGQAAKH